MIGGVPTGYGAQYTSSAVEFLREPAAAEPDDDAPVADAVERRDHLRQQRRVAEADRRHQRAELDLLGQRADRRQRRPRLEDGDRRHRNAVEVIVEPHRVVAELVHRQRRRLRLIPAALDLRQHHTELHSRHRVPPVRKKLATDEHR
jgi:hypothetical protein